MIGDALLENLANRLRTVKHQIGSVQNHFKCSNTWTNLEEISEHGEQRAYAMLAGGRQTYLANSLVKETCATC